MRKVVRPWGNYKLFVSNKKCSVKILEINPRQELSLQIHKKRDESWYFLTSGYVQIKNKKRKIKKGETIKIPRQTPHRIFSKNRKILVLEISFGEYTEKDEVRLEDKYGRK